MHARMLLEAAVAPVDGLSGRLTAKLRELATIALRWASDTSVVTLTPIAGGLAVRHIALPGGPTWEVELPDVANPQLHVRDGRWED